jgi:hypothetical protein
VLVLPEKAISLEYRPATVFQPAGSLADGCPPVRTGTSASQREYDEGIVLIVEAPERSSFLIGLDIRTSEER